MFLFCDQRSAGGVSRFGGLQWRHQIWRHREVGVLVLYFIPLYGTPSLFIHLVCPTILARFWQMAVEVVGSKQCRPSLASILLFRIIDILQRLILSFYRDGQEGILVLCATSWFDSREDHRGSFFSFFLFSSKDSAEFLSDIVSWCSDVRALVSL